jgi:hypothetical protein
VRSWDLPNIGNLEETLAVSAATVSRHLLNSGILTWRKNLCNSRSLINQLQLGAGVANFERVERLSDFGQGFVASGIREGMETNPQAMIVRFRQKVGTGQEHLADQGSSLLLSPLHKGGVRHRTKAVSACASPKVYPTGSKMLGKRIR